MLIFIDLLSRNFKIKFIISKQISMRMIQLIHWLFQLAIDSPTSLKLIEIKKLAAINSQTKLDFFNKHFNKECNSKLK